MRLFSFLLASFLATSANAAHVRFTFHGANAVAQNVKQMTLYPIGAPCTNGAGAIISRDWISVVTGTNGSIVVSNLYGDMPCGQYRGEFKGPNSITTNWFLFPQTNDTIINASDWITAPTNANGILAYSTTQADNRFLINYGSRRTNAGQWHWLASMSSPSVRFGQLKGNFTAWAESSDGLTWTANVQPAFWEPNYYTNYLLATDVPHAGPWARDGAMQICDGEYWYAYNFDPFSTNSQAQGIGLARSVDGTNWARHAVIYPMGTNNPNGRMFAPTWFKDNNGSNYLIGVHGTNILSPAFIAFQIRRLDNSYTNWSAPVNITPTSTTGAGFKWDAYVQRNGNGYEMYYASGSDQAKATNSSLNSAFTGGTNLGWSPGEAPSVIKITPTHWRGLWRNSGGAMQWTDTTNSGVTWDTTCRSLTNILYETSWHAFMFYSLFDGDCVESDYYRESFDGGTTWGAQTAATTQIGVSPLWHGAGIVYISASNSPTAAINQTWTIGTNFGQVKVASPVLAADTVNAKAINSKTVISQDGYFYGTIGAEKYSLGSGDSTVMLFTGTGTPTLAAPNGSLFLKGSGQAYIRTNDTWAAIGGGGGGSADGFGPWHTNGTHIYDAIWQNSSGPTETGSVGIGTNTPSGKLHINRDEQNSDVARHIFLENRAAQDGVGGPNGVGLSLKNSYMSGNPWQIKSLLDDIRITKYGLFSDPLTVDASGDVGITNKLTVTSRLTNSTLTASRVVLSDANKALSSAAASGSVPINADGSATTFAQINALAPGTVLTNGNSFAATLSNNVFIMAGLAVGTNNLSGSNGLVVASPTMANVLSVATNDNKVFVGGSFTATTGITNRTSGGLDITGGANFRGNIQLLGAGSDILESGANDWALAHSFAPKGLLLSTAAAIGFSSTASYAGSKDVGLIRGAAKEVVVTNLAAAANWANLTASNLLSRSSQIILSNVYPFSANLSELAPCGCGTWMSNATLYLICTNSINSTATTNKLGGL